MLLCRTTTYLNDYEVISGIIIVGVVLVEQSRKQPETPQFKCVTTFKCQHYCDITTNLTF